jgi:hypothetical protein
LRTEVRPAQDRRTEGLVRGNFLDGLRCNHHVPPNVVGEAPDFASASCRQGITGTTRKGVDGGHEGVTILRRGAAVNAWTRSGVPATAAGPSAPLLQQAWQHEVLRQTRIKLLARDGEMLAV